MRREPGVCFVRPSGEPAQSSLKPRIRLGVPHHASANFRKLARAVESTDCAFCASGLHKHCPERLVLGIHDLPGGFGPWILAPTRAVHRIPDNVPSGTAVLIEPFAAALNAVADGLHGAGFFAPARWADGAAPRALTTDHEHGGGRAAWEHYVARGALAGLDAVALGAPPASADEVVAAFAAAFDRAPPRTYAVVSVSHVLTTTGAALPVRRRARDVAGDARRGCAGQHGRQLFVRAGRRRRGRARFRLAVPRRRRAARPAVRGASRARALEDVAVIRDDHPRRG